MAKDIFSSSTTTLILGGTALFLLYKSNFFSSLGQGVGNVTSGVGNIGTGLGAGIQDIGVGFANLGTGIGSGFQSIGLGLGSGFNNLSTEIGAGFMNIGSGIQDIGAGFGNLQSSIGTGFQNLLTELGGFGFSLQTKIGNVSIGGNANPFKSATTSTPTANISAITPATTQNNIFMPQNNAFSVSNSTKGTPGSQQTQGSAPLTYVVAGKTFTAIVPNQVAQITQIPYAQNPLNKALGLNR